MTQSVDSLPPIFVISLARATERRANISRHLDETGVPYKIINAVDGATLDMAQLANRLNPNKYRIKYGRKLTSGEIGCYLSHYNLWQHIVDQGIDCAIVLEDDAVLNKDFYGVVSRLHTLEGQWEMVSLGDGKCNVDRVLCDIDDKHRLVRHKRRAWGAHAYVIRRPAAEKLLNYCHEIRAGIDELMFEYWKNDVAFYLVCPPVSRPSGEESQTGALHCPRSPFEKILGSIYRKLDRWRQFWYCRKNPLKKQCINNKIG